MLECRDEGQGPVVLFLHGCPGDLNTFEPLLSALRPDHRVLAPALPGYHGSARLDPYDFAAVDDVLKLLLRDRGVEELAAIVGFSFGAYRALSLALSLGRTPPVVLALGGFAGLTQEEQEGLRGFVPVLRGRRSDDPFLRDLLAQRNLRTAHREGRPEDARLIHDWLDATSAEVIADEIQAITRAPDLHPRLATAPFRLHIRVGTEDVATPSHQARRMAEAAGARATLEEVPNLGHAQLIEDPQGTLDWVLRALSPPGES